MATPTLIPRRPLNAIFLTRVPSRLPAASVGQTDLTASDDKGGRAKRCRAFIPFPETFTLRLLYSRAVIGTTSVAPAPSCGFLRKRWLLCAAGGERSEESGVYERLF